VAQWTKAENLAIYLFMELYPNEANIDLAKRLEQSGFINKRNENAIYQHVNYLEKLKYKLFVPDPVHDFNHVTEE
jgi:hypothetical protein